MSEHSDVLSRWWWPVAWLRIVYGIWFGLGILRGHADEMAAR